MFSVAERILARNETKPFRLPGCNLSLRPYSQESVPVGGGCCILVSGADESIIDDDTLWGLLENRKKGGGLVESLTRQTADSVLVEFAEESGIYTTADVLFMVLFH